MYKHPKARIALLALLGVVGLPTAADAGKIRFVDASNDDRGSGNYDYPSSGDYRRGSFDLRGLDISVEGDFAVFEVTMGAPFRRPPGVRTSDVFQVRLENDIYLQHIDIYLDTEAQKGMTESIPGRNIRFAPEEAWDVAVILTPRPFILKSILEEWKGAKRLIIPHQLQSRGSKIIARVPLAQLGGKPAQDWGYGVAVCGALWQNSFDALNRLRDDGIQSGLTMPVLTIPELRAFGGGEISNYHPQVLDILAPSAKAQYTALSKFDAKEKSFALTRLIYPGINQRPLPQLPKLPTLSKEAASSSIRPDIAGGIRVEVKELQGDLVVLAKPEKPLRTYQMGSVLQKDRIIARVVITAVYPDFLLATAVEGKEAIKKGALVRFEAAKEK